MPDSLRHRLSESLATASKADRLIASYMLAELNNLPFETAASLAMKVGASEATVGRFCRTLGYKSFRDLKDHMRRDIGDRPWLIADRLREFENQAKAGEDQIAHGLKLEIAALVAVYELARTPEWARAVKRLASASAVYAIGFQTERGMAQVFVNQLQYIRDRVHLLDLAGGNFGELLAAGPGSPCLVIFEGRRYSRMAQLLAQDAKNAGIPVTLITDPFCDWGHSLADEMFVVQTEFNLFWESAAQMASLANLLVNGVFLELGHSVEQRMNEIARLYSRYTGYFGDPTGPAGASGT
ncbi:MurR/RpiR family transcriptional regulator [Roseinatronobacter alkalisoli]|uniref:MurR/RpiR family transcriptional regulator n=1 Tax=Roseinatronobacter alkalisoli TaxID=3028235 RepID=A0ABT5TDP8_9RHOB|nr:MurR/RpiR family transcriptional regulator [Roseinatronobacter sp. HJB301]MDD7973240.1 MurR/RpiR family transcriptional regulator [Roseinatronobacter sp. HJB301]